MVVGEAVVWDAEFEEDVTTILINKIRPQITTILKSQKERTKIIPKYNAIGVTSLVILHHNAWNEKPSKKKRMYMGLKIKIHTFLWLKTLYETVFLNEEGVIPRKLENQENNSDTWYLDNLDNEMLFSMKTQAEVGKKNRAYTRTWYALGSMVGVGRCRKWTGSG